MESSKTVIIGLDGVPFGMMKHFAETGAMPNVAELINGGIFRRMESSIPAVSSVAWSSMITGANPGCHGIFGFTDLFEGSYNTRFPDFRDLKARPFWEQWPGKSVIINVPATYPVRQTDGVHISGFVSVDLAKSVYPKSLLPKLNDLDYRLDVDSQRAHSSMELFLADLEKALEARIRTCRYLWDEIDWRTFMVVFTGTDRLMHFLWDAYEDSQHKYHDYFLAHFRKIDNVIGEIISKLSEEDLIIIHSDHGFERLDKDVYINYVLIDNGFLKFGQDGGAVLRNIRPGTKAFALDPGRIYVNLKDKYPCGTVELAEVEELLSQLEDIFGSMEINGRKVIRDIYKREQIYSGLCFENAPDLVLVAGEGFNLKANLKSQVQADKGIFTGKHTQDTAFLILRGILDKASIADVPVISDIKSIIEKNQDLLNPARCHSEQRLVNMTRFAT